MKKLAFVARQGNRPCPEGRENDSPLYPVGHVLECSEVSARRFISKGVAVPYVPEKAAPKAPEPKAEPEKK